MTALVHALAQAVDELPAGTGGFATQLVRTSVALIVVCVAAFWLVRYAAQRGLLGAQSRAKHLSVIDKIALDPRRSVHLVRVGKRVLVLGASDEGLRSLGELSLDELGLEGDGAPKEAADGRSPTKRSFVDVLRAKVEEKPPQ
ncbi:MAG: flagellar biosynthetic protein FliO [Myxococcales bacterium]|nr:flagellar biosynthetic protein FliO [Myxococcales bacterium]